MRRMKVGIAWRPELAAGILAHLDRIDVIEVLADNLYRASRAELRAMRTLARQVPTWLHGVSLGLASTVPVAQARLDALARLAGELDVLGVSEHLAFVRGGGVEIGHLAAPPRTARLVEGAAANARRLRAAVGAPVPLENIATLMAPPASEMAEGEWLRAILDAAAAPFLLDLHNLYANAVNFGRDPAAELSALPLERVQVVHLSGGHWVRPPAEAPEQEARLLDDHVHDVPDAVFALLEIVAARAPETTSVIIERDGAYPDFGVLLAQVERARGICGRE